MRTMKKKVFIGVAWPYVNGELHIGHLAGYLLPADICARYNRLTGNDVLMVSGSDCFGTPITIEADKKGVSPKDIVDMYHPKHLELLIDTLGLSYDLYTKTDTENHIKVTQDLFIKHLEGGYIFIDNTLQYYSPNEARYLPDRYVVGQCPFCNFTDARSDQCDNCGKLISQGQLINPRSNLNGDKVELMETQHYFMDWAKLQPFLEDYVNSVSGEWKEWVRSETLGWLKDGLQSRAITRDLDWGVPLPIDRIPEDKKLSSFESKRIYVWYEAVIGYLSASKEWALQTGNKWEDFWYGDDLKHYYFMGKDNLVFHALFWPGQLKIYDEKLHLPDNVCINMFLNYDGRQFSKSRGVVVNTKEIVDKFGNDAVRFYLTLIMPEVRDSSFNWNDFSEKVNGILVANLGNYIHRVLSIGKGLDAKNLNRNPLWDDTTAKIVESFTQVRNHLEKCEFRNYLEVITRLSSYGNALVDREKLWQLKNADEKRFMEVMKQLIFIILALGYLMIPLLPEAAGRLFNSLGLDNPERWPEPGKEIEEIEKIFKEMALSDSIKALFSKIDYKAD
jgi:methionyl-tRNA synthetase